MTIKTPEQIAQTITGPELLELVTEAARRVLTRLANLERNGEKE